MAYWGGWAILEVADIPSTRGICIRKPIIRHTIGQQWHDASSVSIYGGRKIDHSGEIHGNGYPHLQDTFLDSTPGLTGRSFSADAGSWYDDYSGATELYTRGIFHPIDASGGSYGATSTDNNATALPFAEIHLFLYPPQPGTTSATSWNSYIYFCWPNQYDYRIAVEWGRPFALDYTTDRWSSYKRIDVQSKLGRTDNFLRANGNHIKITSRPNLQENTALFEIGDGYYLHHAPKVNGVLQLPAAGKLSLAGTGGGVGMHYYPLDYDTLQVDLPEWDFGAPLANAGSAHTYHNSLSRPDPEQSVQTTVNGDGQHVQVSFVVEPPPGGGPPMLSDACYCVPAEWATFVAGSTLLPFRETLPNMLVDETEISDSIARTYTYSADITCDNWDHSYSGAYGSLITRLTASNGYEESPRWIGVSSRRGIEFVSGDSLRDPKSRFILHVSGLEEMMMAPLGQEIIVDGFAESSAFRLLGECGNVHPAFMSRIPLYVPPNASTAAPYGPAGPDWSAPYGIVLGSGSGLKAKFRFVEDQLAWDAINILTDDLSWPDEYGFPAAYYQGFDITGQLRVEPVSWIGVPPAATYSEQDPSGLYQIRNLRVVHSVENMRTSIDLIGSDPISGDLLFKHIPQSPNVIAKLGYNYGLIQRSPRLISESYMDRVGTAMQIATSFSTQILVMEVPFWPSRHAGDVIWCYAPSQGVNGLFKIEKLRSVYGLSDVTGMGAAKLPRSSFMICRAVQNTL
jgi:hypothetical protein